MFRVKVGPKPWNCARGQVKVVGFMCHTEFSFLKKIYVCTNVRSNLMSFCILGLSFEAGSLPEPGASVFSGRLEANNHQLHNQPLWIFVSSPDNASQRVLAI